MAHGAFRDEEFRFDFFGYGLECGKDGVVCWVAGRGLAAARAHRILDERSYNFGCGNHTNREGEEWPKILGGGHARNK